MTKPAVDGVLDEVRPYLAADGGDVEVVDVSNGYVFLKLQVCFCALYLFLRIYQH